MQYKNPPVVETVLSVQFEPIREFGASDLGAYREALGKDWPLVSDAPVVDPVFERFEPSTMWEPGGFGVKFSQKIDLRLQIRNRARDRMIQVQNGRFFYNWLASPGSEYPSYDTVRPEFDKQWLRFCQFISSRFGKSVEPNQWEVLYLNHIDQGTVWNELTDVHEVITLNNQPDVKLLGLQMDKVAGEWRFTINEDQGRLYIKLGVKANENARPYLVLTVIARGPVEEGTMSLEQGLDLGHEKITDTFDRITTPEAQKSWGVQHVSN